MNDMEKQEHYTKHRIEPIDYMRALLPPDQFEGYLRGNVLKYLSRYPDKGGVEDLKKAEVYLAWLVRHRVTAVEAPPRTCAVTKNGGEFYAIAPIGLRFVDFDGRATDDMPLEPIRDERRVV